MQKNSAQNCGTNSFCYPYVENLCKLASTIRICWLQTIGLPVLLPTSNLPKSYFNMIPCLCNAQPFFALFATFTPAAALL